MVVATSIDCRDEHGHFCGQSVVTGELVATAPGTTGYCGPDCRHCVSFPVYAVQDGVWCCAADYDYERVEPYLAS